MSSNTIYIEEAGLELEVWANLICLFIRRKWRKYDTLESRNKSANSGAQLVPYEIQIVWWNISPLTWKICCRYQNIYYLNYLVLFIFILRLFKRGFWKVRLVSFNKMRLKHFFSVLLCKICFRKYFSSRCTFLITY